MVSWLLELGANPNSQNKTGQRLLDRIASCAFYVCVMHRTEGEGGSRYNVAGPLPTNVPTVTAPLRVLCAALRMGHPHHILVLPETKLQQVATKLLYYKNLLILVPTSLILTQETFLSPLFNTCDKPLHLIFELSERMILQFNSCDVPNEQFKPVHIFLGSRVGIMCLL